MSKLHSSHAGRSPVFAKRVHCREFRFTDPNRTAKQIAKQIGRTFCCLTLFLHATIGLTQEDTAVPKSDLPKEENPALDAAKKALGKIRKAKAAYEKVIELRDATKELMKNNEEAKPVVLPPQMKFFAKRLDEDLTAIEKDLKDLSVNDFIPLNSLARPNHVELTTPPLLKQAAAFNAVNDYLELECNALEQGYINHQALVENIATGKAVSEAIFTMKEELKNVLTEGGGIFHELRMMWIDLELHYFVRVNSINSNMEGLRREVARELENRGSKVIPYTAHMKTMISWHGEVLVREQRKIDLNNVKRAQASQVLARERETIDAHKRNLDAIILAVESAKKMADNRDKGLVDLMAAQKKYRSDIEGLKRATNAPYTLCPNGHNYKECTHEVEKKTFDREIASAGNKLRAVEKKAVDAASKQKTIERELHQAKQRLDQEKRREATMRAKIDGYELQWQRESKNVIDEAARDNERSKELVSTLEASKESSRKFLNLENRLNEIKQRQLGPN